MVRMGSFDCVEEYSLLVAIFHPYNELEYIKA